MKKFVCSILLVFLVIVAVGVTALDVQLYDIYGRNVAGKDIIDEPKEKIQGQDAVQIPEGSTGSEGVPDDSGVAQDLVSEPAQDPATEAGIPLREERDGDICDVFTIDGTYENASYKYESSEVSVRVKESSNYPQAYTIADIWIHNIDAFTCAFSNGEYGAHHQSAVEVANSANAVVAINGDADTGIVIRNGVLYSEDFRTDDSLLVLYQDGSMETFDSCFDARAVYLQEKNAVNTWAGGPILVKEGLVNSELKSQGIYPISVLGYYAPGHYCFYISDGYSITEIAEMMKEAGCKTAFCLNDSVYAQMVFDGKRAVNGSAANSSDYPVQNMICIVDPKN